MHPGRTRSTFFIALFYFLTLSFHFLRAKLEDVRKLQQHRQRTRVRSRRPGVCVFFTLVVLFHRHNDGHNDVAHRALTQRISQAATLWTAGRRKSCEPVQPPPSLGIPAPRSQERCGAATLFSTRNVLAGATPVLQGGARMDEGSKLQETFYAEVVDNSGDDPNMCVCPGRRRDGLLKIRSCRLK